MKTSQGYALEEVTPEIDPDPAKGSIKLTFLAEAETQQEARERAISYVWKDFTYEAGKVTGWTGSPVPSRTSFGPAPPVTSPAGGGRS